MIGTRGTGTSTWAGIGGAAGTGAAAGGPMGWGTATGAGSWMFAGTEAWGGAGWVGTTTFWAGLGRNATVGRMLIASAISSATTAVMKITASVLLTSRMDR